MQEWWPILAVFWALYLADGLHAGRRERLSFGASFGRTARRGRQASWHAVAPWPSAWQLMAEDLPASLAGEGVSNWPSGSAGRPPPLPDALQTWRWEEVNEVVSRGRWIWINGRRFAPETRALGAAALRQLAAELRPLAPEPRRARLRQWQQERWRVSRLQRRLRAVVNASAPLALLNGVQVAALLLVTLYVVGGGAVGLPSPLKAALGTWWPALALAYAGAHVVAVTMSWRLHRRLLPERSSERVGLVMTALLVPAQALRLRQQLVVALAPREHPLAVALAVAAPPVVLRVARDTLADLRWPRLPDSLPEDARRVARDAAEILAPVAVAALAVGLALTPEELLATPREVSPEVCCWCPRCGDTFVQAGSRCPHGVALLPVKAPR